MQKMINGKVLGGVKLLITCCQKSGTQANSEAEGGSNLGWEPQVPKGVRTRFGNGEGYLAGGAQAGPAQAQPLDPASHLVREVTHRGERTPAHSPAERLLCCFRMWHVLQLGKL